MEEARNRAADPAGSHPRHDHGRGESDSPEGWGLGAKLLGLLALLWVFFRSGSKPSRLSYPCQQSALGLAVSAYGAPLVAAGLVTRGKKGHRPARAFVGPGTLLLIAASWLVVARVDFQQNPLNDVSVAMLAPPQDYHPDVFVVNNARGIVGNGLGGVDDLVTLMGAGGRAFYRSSTQSSVSGPDGLIAADSVVLVKVNAQWSERGGTNTDVLGGVLRRIVEHPDGFVGEIVVADNGQGSGSLTRPYNNADDRSQSVYTVVHRLADEGWNASVSLWDNLRLLDVGEYGDGDNRSGYVVEPGFDPQTSIRVSYPKFVTSRGTYISYKHGVWSPASASYNAEKLVVINLPVLKTHQIYGVTASVKNHMGVVTQSLGTDSHWGVGRGGLGSVLSQVRCPDLTILDCIWVLAIPGAGPSATYAQATGCDKLMAGTDPVALDAWAVKFILMPKIIAAGYTEPAYAAQNPDNPDGAFRRYLDRTMNQLLLADIPATNNYNAVRLHAWGNDHDLDGDLDLDDLVALEECLAGPDGDALPGCEGSDATLDGATDLRDVAQFLGTFTGSF